MGRFEIVISFEAAKLLGAAMPRTIEEHRAMRRGGEYIMLRVRDTGLALFWKTDPGLFIKSS